MKKISFKAGNMLYPLPAVLVGCCDRAGKKNLLTVAWTGTVCTNPPCCPSPSVPNAIPTT